MLRKTTRTEHKHWNLFSDDHGDFISWCLSEQGRKICDNNYLCVTDLAFLLGEGRRIREFLQSFLAISGCVFTLAGLSAIALVLFLPCPYHTCVHPCSAAFLMILMDQGCVLKLPVPVQISAWHQRWHKSFSPGHNNAQSMYNSTGHRHCLADQLSHHIFHLLNYASIWVILSLVLLYNTHTSASLRQSSHLWSMNFAIHDFWLISHATQ